MANQPPSNDQIQELLTRVSDLESFQSQLTPSVTLRAIVEGTAAASGELIFESLVEYLAKALSAKYAFIGQFVDSTTRIRTRSVWTDDRLGENFEYELPGTPCETVLNGEITHFSDGVQERFPKNVLLQALGVKSYLAVPLIDNDEQVLGHLAIMDSNAMPKSDRNLSIFKIFAARATAELKRESTESKLTETSIAKQKVEAEANYLRDELRSIKQSNKLVGTSEALREVMQQVELVAGTESTVLILGESGTGKELLAHEVHGSSRRNANAMVSVNCATLPEPLIESELFGHEKGAFTGATKPRVGRFELANHGTIFLDEIGELPLSGQARLLRVLQEGQFERVGGSKTLKVDVRIIAATNRDLQAMVAEGRFREDLFYRLNVVPIQSPPLRKRKSDIPSLVQHFVDKLKVSLGRPKLEIENSSIQQLSEYNWPGNIRELQNVIERATILSKEDLISIPDGALTAPNELTTDQEFVSLAANEKRHILAALKACNGVIGGPNGAAQLLDINKNTLRSRIEKHKIPLGSHGDNS